MKKIEGVINMKELKLTRSAGIALMKEPELVKVLDKTLDYTLNLKGSLEVGFIYNLELNSLSVHFLNNGELVYWFLFQDKDLKEVSLKKLKTSINEYYDKKIELKDLQNEKNIK